MTTAFYLESLSTRSRRAIAVALYLLGWCLVALACWLLPVGWWYAGQRWQWLLFDLTAVATGCAFFGAAVLWDDYA